MSSNIGVWATVNKRSSVELRIVRHRTANVACCMTSGHLIKYRHPYGVRSETWFDVAASAAYCRTTRKVVNRRRDLA